MAATEWMERAYAASRLAVGATLLAAPGAARPWLGPATGTPDTRSAVRLFAVRDALLGVAAWPGGTDRRARRRALACCAGADVVDAVVAAADWRRTRRPGAAVAVATALGGAAAGAALARLDRS